jgi:hypothetical protein
MLVAAFRLLADYEPALSLNTTLPGGSSSKALSLSGTDARNYQLSYTMTKLIPTFGESIRY